MIVWLKMPSCSEVRQMASSLKSVKFGPRTGKDGNMRCSKTRFQRLGNNSNIPSAMQLQSIATAAA
jgi:hypothetical protein